jgi:S1-C subfamily serine protease
MYHKTVSNPMLEYYGYKGGQTQEQVGTGSGVIISADGYIVTNHVIKDASEIEITLNNKNLTKQNSSVPIRKWISLC